MMNHMILIEMEETYMVEINQSKSKVISDNVAYISPYSTAWQSNGSQYIKDYFNVQILILPFASFPLFLVKFQIN